MTEENSEGFEVLVRMLSDFVMALEPSRVVVSPSRGFLVVLSQPRLDGDACPLWWREECRRE